MLGWWRWTWVPASLLLSLSCGKTQNGDETPSASAGVAAIVNVGGEPSPDSSPAGNGGLGGAGGAAGAPQPVAGEGGEACSETPREPRDDSANADVLALAALAPPDRLVPLSIYLAKVPFDFSPISTGKTREQLIVGRKQQLEPYQAPIQARLEALGATDVGRAWLSNEVSGSIEARFVPDVLCWPNVIRLEVDAAYWTIVDPPWSPTDAGPAECPLVDGECDSHCFEIVASPVIDGVACHEAQQVVACSRELYGIDDDEPTCRQRLDSDEAYVFRGLVPDAPDYLGFRECDGPAPTYFDSCSGGQGPQ